MLWTPMTTITIYNIETLVVGYVRVLDNYIKVICWLYNQRSFLFASSRSFMYALIFKKIFVFTIVDFRLLWDIGTMLIRATNIHGIFKLLSCKVYNLYTLDYAIIAISLFWSYCNLINAMKWFRAWYAVVDLAVKMS